MEDQESFQYTPEQIEAGEKEIEKINEKIKQDIENISNYYAEKTKTLLEFSQEFYTNQ